MQVVFDKIQIDNCWSSHPSTSKINRATVVACHTHNHSCVASMTAQLSMTQVTEATSKTNCPQNTFPSIWRPLKISPAKVEKPTYRTELYYHANFHASRCEISVPGQKIYLFPYRGLPWGLLSHAIHFPEALVKPMLRPNWHVTLQLTVFKIFAVTIWDFAEKTCLGPISTIMQNFTPISVTCAEIALPEHTEDTKNYSRFNIRQIAY